MRMFKLLAVALANRVSVEAIKLEDSLMFRRKWSPDNAKALADPLLKFLQKRGWVPAPKGRGFRFMLQLDETEANALAVFETPCVGTLKGVQRCVTTRISY